MKFKINNRDWEIKEIDSENIKKIYEELSKEETIYVYGLTNFGQNEILINKELCYFSKRHTLMHELMHCYINEYVSMGMDINEEMMCDISANSHDIIHEIVEQYFK